LAPPTFMYFAENSVRPHCDPGRAKPPQRVLAKSTPCNIVELRS